MSPHAADGRRGIVPRPRIIERIASAAARPIVLIHAAAGYGKSVALDQYLAALDGGYVRCDVTDASANLAGFGQAFAVALTPEVGSDDRRDVFARIDEGLERFHGTIAVDGLERAHDDVLRYVVASIERTKARIRWVLASRSSVGLPIGTWLAYGDCDLAIGAADLRFTLEEVGEAARDAGLSVEPDDVSDIFEFTDGWPVAMRIAIQAFPRSSERRELHNTIRAASQHYWAEQVYPTIGDDERALLAVAVALPEIDVCVLDLAGFKNALQQVELFRLRTGLLNEEDGGTYRCPALFWDFLRRQTDVEGALEREAVHLRAARALEASGNVESALTSYVTARSRQDILRLLESNGFDLLERGRAEVTSQAVDALDALTRRTSARILALRGVLQSLGGNPIRAEVLLRRAISQAQGDRDVVGIASLRLVPLIANYGGDVAEILIPVSDDALQSVAIRAEALSLLATTRAIAGEKEGATRAVAALDELLIDIDLDSTRARVLQRVGVAAMYTGENERARQTLMQAADLATELGLHSIASRAWSALSNLMCHAYDDVMSQLWYAERAAGAAGKSGDSLELQTALIQVAAAEMRRGNAEESAAVEEQLVSIPSDPRRAQLLVAFRALRLAWEGRFGEAHRHLATCWKDMHHDFDRLICGAQCALFLALDGRRKSSISLISQVTSLAADLELDGLFRTRHVALALLFCVVAEIVNERATHAGRIVRRIGIDDPDPVIYLAARAAEEFRTPKGGAWRRAEISVALERFTALGYADVARVLQAACSALDARPTKADLTRSELAVLRLLGDGFTTKEIAARDGRSINTIRAHVANTLGKLGCHGRAQAIAVARSLEIIPEDNLD